MLLPRFRYSFFTSSRHAAVCATSRLRAASCLHRAHSRRGNKALGKRRRVVKEGGEHVPNIPTPPSISHTTLCSRCLPKFQIVFASRLHLPLPYFSLSCLDRVPVWPCGTFGGTFGRRLSKQSRNKNQTIITGKKGL